MPIGQIPPWLNIQPEQFQRAYESGAHTGLQLADLRDRRAAAERHQQLQLQELSARAAEREADRQARSREFQERLGVDRDRIAAQERLADEREKNLDSYREAQIKARGSALDLQRSGLELAKEKATAAAEMGDQRAANALMGLDLKIQQLDLAKDRFEASQNKTKEPTVTTEEDAIGDTGQMVKVRRSGPAGLMDPYLPKPPATPTEAPADNQPGMIGRLRDFMFRPPIGRGPVSDDVLGPTLDLRQLAHPSSANGTPNQWALPQSAPMPPPQQESFASEDEARNAGKGAGDVVRIKGVGRVRLK